MTVYRVPSSRINRAYPRIGTAMARISIPFVTCRYKALFYTAFAGVVSLRVRSINTNYTNLIPIFIAYLLATRLQHISILKYSRKVCKYVIALKLNGLNRCHLLKRLDNVYRGAVICKVRGQYHPLSGSVLAIKPMLVIEGFPQGR